MQALVFHKMCEWPLEFTILAKCSKSRAKVSIVKLPHFSVETPMFMPVGTQGTMKGLTCEQLINLNCQIILANTYHLGMRPVCYQTFDSFKNSLKCIWKCLLIICSDIDWSILRKTWALVKIKPIF